VPDDLRAPSIAPPSQGVFVASWTPAITARTANPGWVSLDVRARPEYTAVPRPPSPRTSTTPAGLTAIGQAENGVDLVGGGSAADPRPLFVCEDRHPYRVAPKERLRVLIVEDHLLYA
jgi:hypothetical protein